MGEYQNSWSGVLKKSREGVEKRKNPKEVVLEIYLSKNREKEELSQEKRKNVGCKRNIGPR